MIQPDYVVLESRELVSYFRQAINLCDADLAECITQVIDRMMVVGLGTNNTIYPILEMLRSHKKMKPRQKVELTSAFVDFYYALGKHLLDVQIATRGQCLNYGFHSLRGDAIVLQFFAY